MRDSQSTCLNECLCPWLLDVFFCFVFASDHIYKNQDNIELRSLTDVTFKRLLYGSNKSERSLIVAPSSWGIQYSPPTHPQFVRGGCGHYHLYYSECHNLNLIWQVASNVKSYGSNILWTPSDEENCSYFPLSSIIYLGEKCKRGWHFVAILDL